jgi:hypothetical protein
VLHTVCRRRLLIAEGAKRLNEAVSVHGSTTKSSRQPGAGNLRPTAARGGCRSVSLPPHRGSDLLHLESRGKLLLRLDSPAPASHWFAGREGSRTIRWRSSASPRGTEPVGYVDAILTRWDHYREFVSDQPLPEATPSLQPEATPVPEVTPTSVRR